MENLIQEWQSLDSSELRLFLQKRIGGPGQTDGRDKKRNVLYLPLGRSSCKIKLIFKGKEIDRVEAGPAFDAVEWKRIRKEINESILSGTDKVGREYSFSTFRVTGSWSGARSGVQIVPPPASAPRCNVEGGDHPFILEFPLKASTLPEITNHRRIRLHRQLTVVVNVLLRGHTSLPLPRSRNLWATDLDQGFVSRWVSESFFAPLGLAVIDSLSTITGEQVQEVEPNEYYATIGHDGGGLRVPSDLDESICSYLELTSVNRAKFYRAAFWLEIASRQWPISVSSAVASLVTAVESLTERGATHLVYCDQCGRETQHDAPGPTQLFQRFFEKYAPGRSQKKQRDDMYKLRSGILHGSNVMQIDQDFVFGLDPDELNESELTWELWSVTRIAMRNWLRDPPSSTVFSRADRSSSPMPL